ncbi:lysozyme [Hyphomonas oceanitis]|uniref:Lysozyme n=1 Tax=Hyphomonas oceanitis SCH89 TaxID=1280953 RepID=A0A059GBS4_9PROT|nr:lysozyme [Hyphomonas oceanitis]KDA04271.1 putative lysozyme [Hyphomonas oceanitis SCH89]
MARPMRTSRQGLELIKSFEGFRARAAQLPTGIWIIGYGHTQSARRGLTVNSQDAELLLRHHDLLAVEQAIVDRVLAPLSQNEFDALVSFVFNIGIEAFIASDVLAHLNSGDRLQAADALSFWRKGQVEGEMRVIDALVRRRASEKAMFLEHPSGRASVPSALVTPMLDIAASLMTPRERAVIVETRVDGDRATAAKAKPASNSPQAAARAVNERLTRILGENATLASGQTPPVADNDSSHDGPSIDEITRAVSALADPLGVDEPSSVIDVAKGPPEGIERRRTPRPPSYESPLEFGGGMLPPAEPILVDDLEQVRISDEEIERRLAENDNYHDDTWYEVMREGWPFALLAGLGIIGFLIGIDRFFREAYKLAGRTSDIYIGPLLALGSGVILVISAYYLMRVLVRRT